jgi:hypothetical protein
MRLLCAWRRTVSHRRGWPRSRSCLRSLLDAAHLSGELGLNLIPVGLDVLPGEVARSVDLQGDRQSGWRRPGCGPCRRQRSPGSAGRGRGLQTGRAGGARDSERSGLVEVSASFCSLSKRAASPLRAATARAVWPSVASTEAGSARYFSTMLLAWARTAGSLP